MPTVNFIETAPPENLAKYIEAFWHCRITEKGTLRLLPTASCDFMVHNSSVGMRVALIGPMTTAQVTQIEPGGFFVGVRFRPGCRIDMSEQSFSSLKDTKASTFLAGLASFIDFQKKIQNALTHGEIHSELLRLIKALVVQSVITRDPIVDRFLDELEQADGLPRVLDILKSLPISTRQFQRRFKYYTCLTPKEFIRLRRQQKAVKDLKLPELRPNMAISIRPTFPMIFRSR
jgi:AraC-like DNA-binding protein